MGRTGPIPKRVGSRPREKAAILPKQTVNISKISCRVFKLVWVQVETYMISSSNLPFGFRIAV